MVKCYWCEMEVDPMFAQWHAYAQCKGRAHHPTDWPAEARKAAIALLASGDCDAYGACIGAEALIETMKRREAFGGQPAPGKEEA